MNFYYTNQFRPLTIYDTKTQRFVKEYEECLGPNEKYFYILCNPIIAHRKFISKRFYVSKMTELKIL